MAPQNFQVLAVLAAVTAMNATFSALGGPSFVAATPGVAALASAALTYATFWAHALWQKLGGGCVSTPATLASALTYGFGALIAACAGQGVRTA